MGRSLNITFAAKAIIAATLLMVGCNDGNPNAPGEAPAMSLDEAAQRLAQVSGESIRDYATYDFGRARDDSAKSVVVPSDKSSRVLAGIREELGPGLIAFIGTTRWLGDEQHDGDEIVIAQGNSQFDVLRIARSDAINYDMETEDLIKKLTEYDEQFGIDIFHAETDTIEFVLINMPDDLIAFCNDLYEFCPDIVDQGSGSVEGLAAEIQRTGQVFLWWD